MPDEVGYVDCRHDTIREVATQYSVNKREEKSISLYRLVQRLVQFALMVNVEARQFVNQKTVNALVNRPRRFLAHLACLLFDNHIESPSVSFQRFLICLRATQMAIKIALVAAEEAGFEWNVVLVYSHGLRTSSQLDGVQAETSLLAANGTIRFAILVLAALKAKLKVKREHELFIWV